MKINLTLHGAHYLFRLAQGLQSRKVLNRLYTIYPQFKLAPYEIDKKYVRSFRTLAAAKLIGMKIGKGLSERMHSTLFDRFAAKNLRSDPNQPNIVQGNSGYCLETLRAAREMGIKTIVDRACPHIDFQLTLLDEEAELLTGKKRQFSQKPELKEKMIAEYHEADVILVPSRYSYNSFIDKGFDPKKLHLVPLMKEKNVTRAPENNASKVFTVLAVGFSFYRKGFYYLIKAWRELNLPNAQLILRTTVPKEFQHLLQHKSIVAIDHHLSTRELIRYYQQCDVFCLPSIDEGFGMAAVEGMAAGKPIIVTENVGMSDIITHKKEGFILPIRNSDAIKENIIKLYEDRKLAKEMGEAAYHCEQKYSQARYIDSVISLYAMLIA